MVTITLFIFYTHTHTFDFILSACVVSITRKLMELKREIKSSIVVYFVKLKVKWAHPPMPNKMNKKIKSILYI